MASDKNIMILVKNNYRQHDMHHLLRENLNPVLLVNFILSDQGIDDMKLSKIALHALFVLFT